MRPFNRQLEYPTSYAISIVVFLIILASLRDVMMSWVLTLAGCSTAISLFRIYKTTSLSNLTLLNILSVICILVLIMVVPEYGLLNTMLNLLVVATSLKFITVNNRAEHQIIILILIFLMAGTFVIVQNLIQVVILMTCLFILLSNAYVLNKGAISTLNAVSKNSKTVLQAMLVGAVIFLFAPQYQPFWQASQSKTTQTGLSERLTPGDIANLVKSNELVFRAQFKSDVPQYNDRYWRSVVLDQFDGSTWFKKERTSGLSLPSSVITLDQNYFEYRVVAEMSNTQYLFSLDTPVLRSDENNALFVNQNYQITSINDLAFPAQYIVRSYPNNALNYLPKNEDNVYLSLPAHGNELAKAWVNEQLHGLNFDQTIEKIESLFTTHNFRYTLQPPLMQEDTIDQFLFEYQQGFCSHYASAMTYLLRLNGIPARMVLGYQGGELDTETMLSVYQYDAHAWVEAQHPNKGWLRLDPTALVAPDRTLLGLIDALDARDASLIKMAENSLLNSFIFKPISNFASVVDFNWNTKILGYDDTARRSLINTLVGDASTINIVGLFLSIAICILLFIGLPRIPYKRWFSAQSPTQKVLAHLEKLGFERQRHETLHTFFQRISTNLDSELQKLLVEYAELYYRHTFNSKCDESKNLTNKAKVIVNLKLENKKPV